MNVRHAVTALFLLQLAIGVSAAEAQGRRGRNVITQEEIEKSSATDAYDLIQKLRPAWFTRRGVASGQATTDAVGGMDDGVRVVAYVDGVRWPDLTTVTVERIKEVRYLNASDATTKYGTGHTSGAIEVITTR
jgi:outer membrane cobalamin receptor